MPIYDFQCPLCGDVQEVIMSINDLGSTKVYCKEHTSQQCTQTFTQAPGMSIPANCSYNGQSKFIAAGKSSSCGKEPSVVPINIIDEKPDGSFKVTRIGKKSDIDNE